MNLCDDLQQLRPTALESLGEPRKTLDDISEVEDLRDLRGRYLRAADLSDFRRCELYSTSGSRTMLP